MVEELLTGLDLVRAQTMVRKINDRMSKIADTYGKNSKQAQIYQTMIDTTIPDSNVKFDKGVIKIRKPSSVNLHDLEMLTAEVPTMSQIKSKYQAEFERAKREEGFSGTLKDFIEEQPSFEDKIALMYADTKGDEKIKQGVMKMLHKPHKSENEIKAIDSLMNSVLGTSNKAVYNTDVFTGM